MARTDGVDLRDLELFVAVADTGSMGRAASRHGLTQPAVSMRMTSLERALGVQLLRRDPSGTRLTAAGGQVLADARQVLATIDTLLSTAQRLHSETTSRLRIAASFTVAEHLAPAWIEAMRSDTPGVALALEVLNSAQVLAAVAQRRVDIGFVEGDDRELPSMATRTIMTDRLVVVVPPRHPWASKHRVVSGEELARTELVVREEGSGTREVLDRALEPWGGTRSRLELGSSAALLAAARQGDGPAVLSILAAADDLATGRLCAAEIDGVDLTRSIRAVWPADAELGTLARRLLGSARVSPLVS